MVHIDLEPDADRSARIRDETGRGSPGGARPRLSHLGHQIRADQVVDEGRDRRAGETRRGGEAGAGNRRFSVEHRIEHDTQVVLPDAGLAGRSGRARQASWVDIVAPGSE